MKARLLVVLLLFLPALWSFGKERIWIE